MDNLGQIYGSGMAGTRFDPITFIKKPQVILRIISWVFAVVVFGCISSGGYPMSAIDKKTHCVYADSGACGFGITIGVLAFIACTLFLIADAFFDNMTSVQVRKQVVIGDVAVSGFFTFFTFVSFCYLTNRWIATSPSRDPTLPNDYETDNPQAAIAFSFFSIFTWAGLVFLAWRRYTDGMVSAFAPTYDQDFSPSTGPPFGYPGAGPSVGAESYQEPPFAAETESAAAGPQYKQPAY